MNFNTELQRLRKEKGLSQEALGEMLNVSRQTVSKWESGNAYPDMLNLITISEFFGVSVDALLGTDKNPNIGKASVTENESGEKPARPIKSFHCEYKSKASIKGLPLIHINYGFGDYHAKGVLAIGNSSTGIFSIGIIAKGFLSIGVLSLGIVGVGILSLALLAIGCIALGVVALAGTAVGIMTMGGLAVGVVSVGGCAISSHVSVGGVAIAPVSIGLIAKGDEIIALQELTDITGLASATVKDVILARFPDFPAILLEWATVIFV